MKKQNIISRAIGAVLCAALVLTLAPAAGAAQPAPTESSNISNQEYIMGLRWARTVKSYLYQNELGGLTRVEYIDDDEEENGKVLVEDYNASFVLCSSRTIPMELPAWGGFFAGEDYNFLIFGQNNREMDDNKEVFRIVKYSKDWTRLGSAGLFGANTTYPFDAGSLRCDEYGGWLYVRTSHEMYNGHQANVMIALRQEDMEITDSYYSVMNVSYGYVSHSFNQFILIDQEGRIVALDHGDAYPRSLVLMRYYAKAGQDSFRNDGITWTDQGGYMTGTYMGWVEYVDLQKFPGAAGDNDTGCSVGGLAETSNGYVAAYSYNGTGMARGTRDIYLSFTDKELSADTPVRVTTDKDATTPQLASVGPEGGYVLWNEWVSVTSDWGYTYSEVGDTLYYAAYDADGNVGAVQTAQAALSDCAPVLWQGKAVWYVTDYSTPVFYLLDENGVSVKITDASSKFSDVPADSYFAAPVAWAVNAGVTNGTSDDTFTPDRTCTHGEIIAMLWRAAGSPQGYPKAPLESLYFQDAIDWAYERKIIGDSFQEGNPCTRADTVVYMWRTAGGPAASSEQSFSDVPDTAWYVVPVNWAVENGITTGSEDGSIFSPGVTCDRAQIVTFLCRYFT